jgi:hypothetical protein
MYKYREGINSEHRTWVSNEKLCQDETSTPCPQSRSATLNRSAGLEKSDRTMFYWGNGVSGSAWSGFRFPIMSDKRWWRW